MPLLWIAVTLEGVSAITLNGEVDEFNQKHLKLLHVGACQRVLVVPQIVCKFFDLWDAALDHLNALDFVLGHLFKDVNVVHSA